MKSLEHLLSTYKSVHLNKQNIATHFIGIPLILWSVALLFATLSFTVVGIDTNVMQVLAVVIFTYYLLLDVKLGLIAILLIAPIWFHAQSFVAHQSPYLLAIGVFVIGWLFQFIGHFFEKAKPAFFDDLKQLLIGPLFLVAELCFLIGLFSQLEQQISKEALKLRAAINSDLKN
ncbi:DUF962 domain-containing protein [Thalassotalea aquiviva]|uniref:Mpo1 family 2-hydroxy fatty acid dioxygenase n=1 Tax=Thalassotalea aquiviva TaxID=3242415 RepID=UPI00352A2B04